MLNLRFGAWAVSPYSSGSVKMMRLRRPQLKYYYILNNWLYFFLEVMLGLTGVVGSPRDPGLTHIIRTNEPYGLLHIFIVFAYIAFRYWLAPILYSSVADPADFWQDPDPSKKVRIQIRNTSVQGHQKCLCMTKTRRRRKVAEFRVAYNRNHKEPHQFPRSSRSRLKMDTSLKFMHCAVSQRMGALGSQRGSYFLPGAASRWCGSATLEFKVMCGHNRHSFGLKKSILVNHPLTKW
jgi:hypothetical protein